MSEPSTLITTEARSTRTWFEMNRSPTCRLTSFGRAEASVFRDLGEEISFHFQRRLLDCCRQVKCFLRPTLADISFEHRPQRLLGGVRLERCYLGFKDSTDLNRGSRGSEGDGLTSG